MQGRCLIIKPSSLGDIVHAFPAVSLVAKRHPGLRFDWVAVPAFKDLVLRHPTVERVIPFPRKELGKVLTFPRAFLAMMEELRREKYDCVLDFQGLLRSGILGFLARSRQTAGPADPREKGALLFYGRRLERGEKTLHAVERNMREAASFLGENTVPEPEFSFRPDPEARSAAEKLLEGRKGPVIAAAPGARWLTKQWPPEFFAAVLQEVHRQLPEAEFAVLGSPGDFHAGEMIASALKGCCRNLCGKTTMSSLIETISLTRAFLCNDSGPMHLAAALKVPVTALFGPTDPKLTGPYMKDAVVLQPKIRCIGCFRSRCPDQEKCHSGISVQDAAAALLRSF